MEKRRLDGSGLESATLVFGGGGFCGVFAAAGASAADLDPLEAIMGAIHLALNDAARGLLNEASRP